MYPISVCVEKMELLNGEGYRFEKLKQMQVFMRKEAKGLEGEKKGFKGVIYSHDKNLVIRRVTDKDANY